jgi:hypothetical protein
MVLSVIIVSFNTKELLKECITSAAQSLENVEHEIIVVDNNSSDESVAMLREGFPNVRVILNNYNAGFAKANNQGYAVSSGSYVLLLNSDTIAEDSALRKLIEFLDTHPDVAVAGPRLLNPDLSLQLPCRRGFPRLVNSICYFSGVSRLFPRSKLVASYNMTHMDDGVSHEVDAVSGACMVVRRCVVDEIGGLLDEGYFMHFEDIDLCFRAKVHEYRVWYVHDAKVVHLKGQSSKLRSRGVRRDFYQSALRYFEKNYRNENRCAYYMLVAGIKFLRMLCR